jgi:hypothetical protein
VKTDQIIAELFSLLRLLLERQASPQPDVIARLAALESWRVQVESVWPLPTQEQEI